MTVVVDTNALWPALSARHPSRVMVRAWAAGRFAWAISTEILLEYEEILVPRLGPARWREFVELLDTIGELRGNLRHIEPSFRFRLIAADPDDDKFADCAIAAEADWVITEDGHFDSLRGAGYQPQPIAPADFIARFLSAP